MSELERLTEALARAGNGDRSHKEADILVFITAARVLRDLIANGERVEWCEPHRNEAWEDFQGDDYVFTGYRCAAGSWIEGANAWDCRIVSRLLSVYPKEAEK